MKMNREMKISEKNDYWDATFQRWQQSEKKMERTYNNFYHCVYYMPTWPPLTLTCK